MALAAPMIVTIATVMAIAPEPVAAFCLSSSPCAPVNVDGINYEVSYSNDSFNNLESTLTQQPWWGNEQLATSLAQDLADSLGFPNGSPSQSYGPYFAHQIALDSVFSKTYQGSQDISNLRSSFGFRTNYAVATSSAVPTPTILPGLIGLGIAAGCKKKSGCK